MSGSTHACRAVCLGCKLERFLLVEGPRRRTEIWSRFEKKKFPHKKKSMSSQQHFGAKMQELSALYKRVNEADTVETVRMLNHMHSLSCLPENLVSMYRTPGFVEFVLHLLTAEQYKKIEGVRSTALGILYNLTTSDEIRGKLRASGGLLVDALMKNQKTDKYARLALVNIYGASCDQTMISVDEDLIVSLFELLDFSRTPDADICASLCALRYICVVPSNVEKVFKYAFLPIDTVIDAVRYFMKRDHAYAVFYGVTVLAFLHFSEKGVRLFRLKADTLRVIEQGIIQIRGDREDGSEWSHALITLQSLLSGLDPSSFGKQ